MLQDVVRVLTFCALSPFDNLSLKEEGNGN